MWTIQSINPYNGEVNAEFQTLSNDELDVIIQRAHDAHLEWKQTSWEHRKQLFHKLADIMDADAEKYAELQTIEMGMLYSASLSGVKSTASLIRWFADNAEDTLGDKEFDENGTKGKYKHDALGVIYGVGPWNFPYNQVLRAAVPNILAGNTTVYKHASIVPMCAEQIEKFFDMAGFPKWIYTNIFISGSQSEHIIANKHVAGVNLTGSEWAGSAVGSLAGKYLKRSVLELWGNDAFVLADHSDTKQMVREATACRISNGGQKCNSSKRFIVMEKHYDEFVEEMGKYMETMKTGNPMEASTQIPPMSSLKLVNDIDDQVQRSISEGARLIVGWKKSGDRDQFYEGTILADVTSEMTSYNEEIFGPVASIIKSKDIQDSIRIANDSDFGLSAVVYGDDETQCREIADQLEGGMIFINEWAASKPHLPFGGVKKSGYGKENGREWLREFTNKKAIIYSK